MLLKTIAVLLVAVLFAQAKDYKGAELRTKESFLYGRFEVNYKAARGTGLLSNFFTYNDFEVCCNEWNEIDIEILGRYDDDVQTTTITPRQTIYNSHNRVDFAPFDVFNTYAFEWTPDYVAWFVNGEEIYRQTGAHIQTLTYGQKLMMNIWAAVWEPWVGEWNPAILPVFAWYDWVAYYAYTPGEGDSGTNNNFQLEWRDEFDEWDEERWEKASHTWSGNRVDMSPDNAIFRDGYLVLAITDAAATGFVDNKPPVLLWARAKDSTITAEFSEDVDSVSASILSNYVVPGLQVKSVELQRDKRTVLLATSPMSDGAEYSLVIFGISDAREEANLQSYNVVPVYREIPLTFPLQINAGGDAVYGGSWLADQVWGPNVEYGHMDGYHQVYNDADVQNSELDSLYLSALDEVVKYRVRVPRGTYNVELGFAELDKTSAGQRVFSIDVEGTNLVKGLDLVQTAGIETAYKLRMDNVTVEDGILDIHFTEWTGHPLLSSIRVEQLVSTQPGRQSALPRSLKIHGNYPNPFNPLTRIDFYLPARADVRLTVFDAGGREVYSSRENDFAAGERSLNFDARAMASGVYYYRLSAKSAGKTVQDFGKMVLIK